MSHRDGEHSLSAGTLFEALHPKSGGWVALSAGGVRIFNLGASSHCVFEPQWRSRHAAFQKILQGVVEHAVSAFERGRPLRSSTLNLMRRTGQKPRPARKAFAERKSSAIRLVRNARIELHCLFLGRMLLTLPGEAGKTWPISCWISWIVFGAWRSPVSALVWGTRGRRFKSSRSDHLNQGLSRHFRSDPRPLFTLAH
jgi:hypothetical protein